MPEMLSGWRGTAKMETALDLKVSQMAHLLEPHAQNLIDHLEESGFDDQLAILQAMTENLNDAVGDVGCDGMNGGEHVLARDVKYDVGSI